MGGALIKQSVLIILTYTILFFAEMPAQVIEGADSTQIVRDTVNIGDSTATKVERVLLKPIYSEPFLDSETGTTVNQKIFQRSDYRYTGDILKLLPFVFNKYKGTFGQTHESLIYGNGFSSQSVLENGIPVNNRSINSFNYYNFQTEIIDSLELPPFTRGFLFDMYSNPVSINLAARTSIAATPITRLRFLQGPNEEGYLDALFNGYIFKRVNISFQVTNAVIDSTFSNDSYSSWQVFSTLRYLLNNDLNILANFRYVNSETRLFGGIDRTVTTDIYDKINSIPLFSSRYSKNREYHFNVNLLGNIAGYSPFNISFYYSSNFVEFRQNENLIEDTTGKMKIVNNNENYTAGLYFRNTIDVSGQQLDIIARAENVKYKIDALQINDSRKALSVSGITQLDLFEGSFNPSVFGKYLFYNEHGYIGFGSDININVPGLFNVFAGMSYSEKPYNRFEEYYLNEDDNKSNAFNFEAGLKFSLDNLDLGVSLFLSDKKNNARPLIQQVDDQLENTISNYDQIDFTSRGINLYMHTGYAKFQLDINASLYSLDTPDEYMQVPQFNFYGGLYYVDTLFNANLDLKTGFNFRSAGEQNPYVYDYQQERAVLSKFDPLSERVSAVYPENVIPYFITDFFVSGVVQEKAIVYFVMENLFDINYFVVPYYPAPGRSVRFGISWEFLE